MIPHPRLPPFASRAKERGTLSITTAREIRCSITRPSFLVTPITISRDPYHCPKPILAL
jgi:hypothetical protein